MIPLRDDIPSRGTPIIVRGLIFANIGGFCLQLIAGRPFTEWLALKPAQVFAAIRGESFMHSVELVGASGQRVIGIQESIPGYLESFLPFLTSQFLHADLLHLGANLLFLWIFADNVEGELGSRRFLGFYLLCGICAGIVHVVLESTSTIPTIGASGAIAGVLGAYFICFPRARVLTLIPIFIFPLLVEVPAVAFLGLWFLLQVLWGLTGSGGNMAVWAHSGGFVTGLLLIGLFTKFHHRGPRPRYRTVRFERTG